MLIPIRVLVSRFLGDPAAGEFGIRMALGAQPSSILRLVMSDTFVLLAGGITVGAVLSLATVQLLQKMLFGHSPHDLTTMLIAIVVLAAVGLVAGFLPARRATRVIQW